MGDWPVETAFIRLAVLLKNIITNKSAFYFKYVGVLRLKSAVTSRRRTDVV